MLNDDLKYDKPRKEYYFNDNDLAEHDSELLDKVYTELKKYKREINLANTPWNFIELIFSKMKDEVSENANEP